MRCEKCGIDREGQNYQFFFGNLVDTKISGTTNRIIKQEIYSMKGSSVFICNECYNRGPKRTRLFTLIGLAFIEVVLIFLALSAPIIGFFSRSGYFILAGILGISIIIGLASSLVIKPLIKSDRGSMLAVSLKRKECEKEGYDTLMTPREYYRLKPYTESEPEKGYLIRA